MSSSLLEFLVPVSRQIDRPQEDAPGMPNRSPDADAATVQASVRRLIDLIQILVPSARPGRIVEAIEQCVLTLVVEELRQRIQDRLTRFTPEEISHVEALTAQIAQTRDETSEPPNGGKDVA